MLLISINAKWRYATIWPQSIWNNWKKTKFRLKKSSVIVVWAD